MRFRRNDSSAICWKCHGQHSDVWGWNVLWEYLFALVFTPASVWENIYLRLLLANFRPISRSGRFIPGIQLSCQSHSCPVGMKGGREEGRKGGREEERKGGREEERKRGREEGSRERWWVIWVCLLSLQFSPRYAFLRLLSLQLSNRTYRTFKQRQCLQSGSAADVSSRKKYPVSLLQINRLLVNAAEKSWTIFIFIGAVGHGFIYQYG